MKIHLDHTQESTDITDQPTLHYICGVLSEGYPSRPNSFFSLTSEQFEYFVHHEIFTLLVCKSLNGAGPAYLFHMLQRYEQNSQIIMN